MEALDGLREVEKASFDAASERFVVTVRAGRSLSRRDVERVVAQRARDQELTYRVVWDVEGKPASESVKRGAPFSAPLLAGGTYDFADVLGKKPIVLTFWASWCAPCIEEAPHLQRLFDAYNDAGVAFAAVSIDVADDHPTLRALVRERKLAYPVPLDPRGEVLAKYASGAGIPLTFVLSRSGEVVYRRPNFEPGDEVALEAAIKEQLAAARGRP